MSPAQIGKAKGGRPRHVLVVEDLPLSQEIARLVLQAGGHRVDVAENGAEAVAFVRRRRYDIVLMDLDLPVMDGYAATGAIRRLPRARCRVPVMALTARTGEAEAERCRQAGLNGHITKPFVPNALLSAVAHWTQEGPRARIPRQRVWDDACYRELVRRLGAERMGDTLPLFAADLLAALGAVRAAPGDRALLERKAHGIASTAGMLGFAELLAACRFVMQASPRATWPVLFRRFSRAAERVLARLQQRLPQAADAVALA